MSWVRIHSSSVKNEKDSFKLFKIQSDCQANFNTHTKSSMWFDFPSTRQALKFVESINEELSYLKFSMGN